MILATRYARALYGLAKENNEQDVVFEQMRSLEVAFEQDKDVAEFVHSPVVRSAEKTKLFESVIAGLKLAPTLGSFLLLLAKKNRLPIFGDVVKAYQTIADEAHGVTRGTVRSAAVLDPEERKRISELVSKATKKQVVLTYKEDQSLLGGLVAEVGSYTLDDSLTAHLKRINEQLNRSAH